VDLKDARILSVSLAWLSTLANASQTQLQHYEILGDGEDIYWLDLGNNVNVKGWLIRQHQDIV